MVNARIEDSHVYMPAFSLKRLLATYPMDTKAVNTCNKISNRHKALTPGVCTLFCAHGVCLGFKLLAKSEGPSTIFDMVATRFEKGKQPANSTGLPRSRCREGLGRRSL